MEDFHRSKKARLSIAESMTTISDRSHKEESSSLSSGYSSESKPLPSEFAEFLSDPYKYRVSGDFLDRVSLDVITSLFDYF